MQFRYLGFDQLENARAYRFAVISRTEDDRQFVVTVDLSLFRKHGVGIQEGPSLCAQKLGADLEGAETISDGPHELTAEDFQAYVTTRTAVEERKLQARRAAPRRSRSPLTHPQSPWRRSQEEDRYMPFQGFQRYSFSTASVRQNAPHAPGVYGLSNADEWIFVGTGEDIQAALMNHLNAAGTAVSSRMPTGFIFEACEVAMCVARQERLIAELKPTCNAS